MTSSDNGTSIHDRAQQAQTEMDRVVRDRVSVYAVAPDSIARVGRYRIRKTRMPVEPEGLQAEAD